jgi:hypothetical protein
MPRGKKRAPSSDSDDESEFELSDDHNEHDDDDGDGDDDDNDEQDLHSDNDLDDDAEEAQGNPSQAPSTRTTNHPLRAKSTKQAPRSTRTYGGNEHRLTERGGYSHNHSSKLKISMGNKGNTPWNKDKHRSGTDKAKISAGVKARNRAILLQRLARANMTEEEYEPLKKKTKLVRERLRRLKVANAKAQQDRLDRLENKPKQASESESEDCDAEADDVKDQEDREGGHTDEEKESDDLEVQMTEAIANTMAETTVPTEASGAGAPAESASSDAAVHPALESSSHFAGSFSWEPHPFDSDDVNVYSQTCPEGGPGGLICCAVCTSNYSQYMTTTCNSMHDQMITLLGHETRELASYLERAQSTLDQTVAQIRTNAFRKPRSKAGRSTEKA